MSKELDKRIKGMHRQTLIDNGQYGIFKEKTIKDKTTYNRKEKHKSKGWD